MGEKETTDSAARSGSLDVAAAPGGSAGILSTAVSSVSNVADGGDASGSPADAGRDKLKGSTKTQGDFTLSN
jgi:hypothetical protein